MSREPHFFSKHSGCQVCTETIRGGFKYIETQQGEKYMFELLNTFTLVFLIEGEALISCNEAIDMPIKAGEMALWSMNSTCYWTSTTDTVGLILEGGMEMTPCDSKSLKDHADKWLDAVSSFQTLGIHTRLMQFLKSVQYYLQDGITCPYMHKSKLYELSMLFRAYYQPEELTPFFLPTVRNTHEFETFVMNNYLKMKGVKEFVDLSGMNLATFNRKFKLHFRMTPYQWLIKQKSKHIYHELSASDKRFIAIAKDFQFSDASHFNRYCKLMFGASPSQIRKKHLNPENSTIAHNEMHTKRESERRISN